MSAATSPGTGLAYGLRRVCAAWGMARSSFYAMPPASTRAALPGVAKPGDLRTRAEVAIEARPGSIALS